MPNLPTEQLLAASVLFAFYGLFVVLEQLLPARVPQSLRRHLRSLTFIALGAIAMSSSTTITPGVVMDQRAAVIAIATALGGWRTGLVTAATIALFRLNIGGSGVPSAMFGIAATYLACVVIGRLPALKRGSAAQLGALGLAASTIDGLSLALSVWPIHSDLMTTHGGLISTVVQFFTTMMLGALVHLQELRAQHVASAEQQSAMLRSSLRSAMGALAAAVGQRDPFTAGHQQRVAHLAVAIAERMHLPADQIDGLQLAAEVHDVGQIRIPAEILTRPRKLLPVEFALLKEHAEAGYEILREVPLPWPVADIVRQHHENYDGSGYPAGLKGDAICLEARIIRVCDAMEAMMSHRPFRAALPRDTAMAELEKGAGSSFDPAIVGHCIALFREERYEFPHP